MPVVELAFAGQIKALHKTLTQRGFESADGCSVECLSRLQLGHGAGGGVQLALKARGLGRVLAVPDDQGAVVLKEGRLRQLRDEFGPALEAVAAHAHHAVFGHRRFGQRCQHGRSSAGGRPSRIRGACLMHYDLVTSLRERHSQQPAHEAST